MSSEKLVPAEIYEMEDTSLAMEILVKEIDAALKMVDEGELESYKKSIKTLYKNAELLLNGSAIMQLDTSRRVA